MSFIQNSNGLNRYELRIIQFSYFLSFGDIPVLYHPGQIKMGGSPACQPLLLRKYKTCIFTSRHRYNFNKLAVFRDDQQVGERE